MNKRINDFDKTSTRQKRVQDLKQKLPFLQTQNLKTQPITFTDRSSRSNFDLADVAAEGIPEQIAVNYNHNDTNYSDSRQNNVLDQNSFQDESLQADKNPLDTGRTEYDESRIDIGSAEKQPSEQGKSNKPSQKAKMGLTLSEHRKEFIFETFEQRPSQVNRSNINQAHQTSGNSFVLKKPAVKKSSPTKDPYLQPLRASKKNAGLTSRDSKSELTKSIDYVTRFEISQNLMLSSQGGDEINKVKNYGRLENNSSTLHATNNDQKSSIVTTSDFDNNIAIAPLKVTEFNQSMYSARMRKTSTGG